MNKLFLQLFCVSFLCSSCLCSAQSFQRLFGSRVNDELSSILLLRNGDYIVCGTTLSRGNGDIYVARLDSTGSIVWQNLYGGTRNESNCVAVINNNGNIIIAASSSSYNGGRDLNLLLFEIDLDGLLRWSRSYDKGANSSTSDEIPKRISLSPTGLIICATIGAPNTLSPDVLLLELNNDGTTINWQNQIGASGNFGDIPSSVISSRNGGYIVVGGSFSTNNNYDQVVWRLNARGILQSNFAFGGTQNENAHDIIELANNDIIVLGNFRRHSGTGLEYSLANISSNNRFNWLKTYGDNGTRDERAFSLIRTGTGFGLCGYTNAFGMGNNDVLLVWTNNQGVMNGSTSVGDSRNESSSGIVQNADGSFTLVGISDSQGTGLNDGFVVRTNINGSIDNNCSSNSIIERDVVTNTRSYNYSESNPQLGNQSVNVSQLTISLTEVDFVCPGLLPVELISFSCFTKDNKNYLQWSTSIEENSSHYMVERSDDGVSWESIGTVISIGNSTNITNYSYTDDWVFYKLIYYRLKQFDKDGSFTYSKTIALKSGIEELRISPIPTDRFVYVKGISTESGFYEVVLSDLDGSVIYNKKSQECVLCDVEIDLQNYNSGIYILKILTSEKVLTSRVFKN